MNPFVPIGALVAPPVSWREMGLGEIERVVI